MYKPQSGLSGPKYGMTGRKYYAHDEKVPGPGAYTPKTKQVYKADPNYGMGS